MTSETNYCELGRVKSVGRDLVLLWQGYGGEGHIHRGNKVSLIPQLKEHLILNLVSGFHPNSPRTLDPEVIHGFIGVHTY